MVERSERPNEQIELTERQRSVLRAVVEDYLLTAVPVGSKALVARYALPVSSATVPCATLSRSTPKRSVNMATERSPVPTRSRRLMSLSIFTTMPQ